MQTQHTNKAEPQLNARQSPDQSHNGGAKTTQPTCVSTLNSPGGGTFFTAQSNPLLNRVTPVWLTSCEFKRSLRTTLKVSFRKTSKAIILTLQCLQRPNGKVHMFLNKLYQNERWIFSTLKPPEAAAAALLRRVHSTRLGETREPTQP